MRRSILIAVSTSLAACSSGQLGVNGQVRFSQVVNFAETTDFGPPLVVNAGLLVQLEYPGLGEEQVNPSLSLVVADKGQTAQSGHVAVVPLGFAQYAILADKGGDYTLLAQQNGQTVDTLPISAAGAGALHWHAQATVTVTGVDSGSGVQCSTTSSVPLAQLVLAPNASITLVVVPDDGQGNALLGMLELTATAQGPAQLTSGWLGQGLTPNSVTVAPQGTLGGTIHLTAADAVTGKSLTLDIPTQTAPAAVTCSN